MKQLRFDRNFLFIRNFLLRCAYRFRSAGSLFSLQLERTCHCVSTLPHAQSALPLVSSIIPFSTKACFVISQWYCLDLSYVACRLSHSPPAVTLSSMPQCVSLVAFSSLPLRVSSHGEPLELASSLFSQRLRDFFTLYSILNLDRPGMFGAFFQSLQLSRTPSAISSERTATRSNAFSVSWLLSWEVSLRKALK